VTEGGAVAPFREAESLEPTIPHKWGIVGHLGTNFVELMVK
jgi:hypothetical protein